ncbi:uncharacterized protein LOC141906713 isoform X2 [Tubulanus polymorphus]|uniref:uncharacterized protein LOC141906713 isoform X2 n=1 Tax=Tubulanus polymorphus TaxID=672921 RepID=UPI003DA602D6
MMNDTNTSYTITVGSINNVTLITATPETDRQLYILRNDIIIPVDVIIFLFVCAFYIFLGIRLWKNRTLSSVIVLKTPNSTDCHPYLITIVTSYLRGASSISPRISLRMIGSDASSGEYKITGRNGLKDKPFQKGKLDMFYCNGPDNLGVLEYVEIKHKGPDNWYVTCVSVQDLDTKLWYRCKDSRWLRAEPNEENIHQFPLTTHLPPEGILRYVLYYFLEQMGDMHIWMSLTQWQCPCYMPTFARFLLCAHFLTSFMFFAAIARYADIYRGFRTGFAFILLAAVSSWIFETLLRLTEPRRIRRTPVHTVRSCDLLNTTVQSSASSSTNSVCANAGIVKLPCFPSDISAIAHVPDGWEREDNNKTNKDDSITKQTSGANGSVGAEKEKLLPKSILSSALMKASSPKPSGKQRRPVPPPPRKKQEMNGNVVAAPGAEENENLKSNDNDEKQFVKKMPPDDGSVVAMNRGIDEDYHRLSSDESIDDDSSMPDPLPKKTWGRMLWDPIINAYSRLSGALATEPEEVVVEMRKLGGTPISSHRFSMQPSVTASDLESFYTARNSWISDDRSLSSFTSFRTGSVINMRSLRDAVSFEEFNSVITLNEENDFDGPIFATYMLESELLDIELEARNARHRPLPYFIHYVSYILLTFHIIGMFIATPLFGISLSNEEVVSWLGSLFYAVIIEAAMLEVFKLIVCAVVSYLIRVCYDRFKTTSKRIQLEDNSVNTTTANAS